MSLKYLPNIITISRIFIALSLLFFDIRDIIFIVLFLICGFTDVVDGFLSRKMNTQSDFGARLDSFADLVMYFVLIYKYINSIYISNFFIFWIVIIIFLRILPAFINYIKYKSLSTIHTYGNKFSGLLVFCFPILYYFFPQFLVMFLICFICTIAAVEEIIISIISTELNLNQKSIFFKKQ